MNQIMEKILTRINEFGVKRIVISYKSQTLRIIHDTYEVYEIFDRRSAAYFAMGLAQQLGEPVLLLCENKDAELADFLPGITEAYYQRVPLLILSISGDTGWLKDVEHVIGDKCKRTIRIDKATNINWALNGAILALTDGPVGPVLLEMNLDENISIPVFRGLKKISKNELLSNQDFIISKIKSSKVKLVLDAIYKYKKEELELLSAFMKEYNISLFEEDVYSVLNKFPEYSKSGEDYDLLIMLGDEQLQTMHNKTCNSNVELWVISEDENVLYRHDHIDVIIDCKWYKFISLITHSKSNEQRETPGILKRDEDGWDVENVVRIWSNSIEQPSWVFLAYEDMDMSSALKDNPYLSSCFHIPVTGNDGRLSMFIGQTVVADELCFCIIDSTSFFRDMNALHIQHIKGNTRILVICYDGVCAKHIVDWAGSNGIDSMCIDSEKSFRNEINNFVDVTKNVPQLIAVVLNGEEK